MALGAASILGALAGDVVARGDGGALWGALLVALGGSTALLALAPASLPLALASAVAFGASFVALSGILIVWATRLDADRPAAAVSGAFVLLATTVNLLAAALSLSGLLGYVFVYTLWLKRLTPQNIVIGGAAGAVPPLVAWAAVTGGLTGTPLYLFAIVFFWTPPHFWALSLLMKDEYARAGVPMLPVVRGERETRRQILLYTVLLYAVSQLPFCAGAFGVTYLIASVLLGAAFIYGSWRLMRRADKRSALRLYLFSLGYLAALFAAMVADVRL